MRTRTKVWFIIAASLLLVGCIIFGGVMTMLKWDFTKLSTVKYETNTYEISEDFNNISIIADTADILFVPSESSKGSVVCYEQKNAKHSVTVKDGTLAIEVVNTKKWYEYIGINFGTPKITVYIPQKEYGTLSVKSSTGDIRIENISAGELELSVSTGDIAVAKVKCERDIKIDVSTGKTKVTDTNCQSVVSTGSTGDISFKNVIATEKFSLERSTGDLKFSSCDAAEIYVKTETGDVIGTLLSKKVFITETDTGSIDVPKTITGGRCEIKTDTGDIKIDVL
ncbi:MAG: DUF4097 family beta strand repeat protein [Clostridia bacterium]|nr:DUF4097 family beta strand repeat protein [Clostridia bacterium]